MKSYYLFGSLQIENNSKRYNRFGKQQVLNSLAKQGRILSITNRKGKNDNSFIYSGNLLTSLKVSTVVTRVVMFLNFYSNV